MTEPSVNPFETTDGYALPGRFSDTCIDCLDHPPSALAVLFCAPCRFAKTMTLGKIISYPKALTLYGILWLVWVGCMVAYWVHVGPSSPAPVTLTIIGNAVFITLALIRCQARGRLRAKFQMRVGCCERTGDCLGHLCCSCCMSSQEARHVDRNAGLIGQPQVTTVNAVLRCQSCCLDQYACRWCKQRQYIAVPSVQDAASSPV